MKNRSPTTQDESVLAERLRAERKRLGLSVASVAHYCGVAHSTVVNWETNKARMPFVAAMELWRRGFNMEQAVQSQMPVEQIQMHRSNDFRSVPSSLLLRHKATASSTFIFHNKCRFDDCVPAGELCLMRKLVDDIEAIVEQGDGIYLVRPHGKKEAFLCHFNFRGKPKGRILIGVGEAIVEATMRKLLTHADVIGKYLCGLGLMPDDNPKSGEHWKALLILGKKLA